VDGVRPDDLDREIERFFDAELLRARTAAGTGPLEVPPGREPPAAPAPRGGYGIWLWTGSLWLLVLAVTLLPVLFR
jgi:hypothetical protein